MEKRETANRVRGRIETIIAKNVDIDDPEFRNPAELTRQMREKLPKRSKRVVRHHPALPYGEAPAFLKLLDRAPGRAAAMLRFLIFTACRTNEVVEARWSEIDRPNAAWKIPGERMKMDQHHYVPLSGPALAVLDELRDGRQGELIFTSPARKKFAASRVPRLADIALDELLSLQPSRLGKKIEGAQLIIGGGSAPDHHVEFGDDLACLDQGWHASFYRSDGHRLCLR